MMTDVRRLRSLLQVAERGTITAAAEALGYTPSAISQQLTALEAELGVPVLERRGRNVMLTDAGEVLVTHGREVLASLERTEAAVAELHGEPVGRVRIGALPSATASLLPPALQRLRAIHPRVEPEVVVHPLDENIRELRLGSLDVAVDQSYEFAPHDLFDGMDVTVLLEEPLVLLSPVEDPRSSVLQAQDCDWVASPSGSACRTSTDTIAARAGFSTRVRYETEDHAATVRLVAAGLAVAVVPQLALTNNPAEVHVAVVPAAHRQICAITRPTGRPRPAVQAVIEQLQLAAADVDASPKILLNRSRRRRAPA